MVEKSYGGFLIGKIKQIQGRIFDKMLSDHGIREFNGAQGRILFVLWQEDDIPIRTLSEKTGLAKTTLTSMLDRLEKTGHIQRAYSQSDRRMVKIRLTKETRDLKEQYNKVSAEMTELFYQGFSDDEIRTFETCLGRILANLTREEQDL